MIRQEEARNFAAYIYDYFLFGRILPKADPDTMKISPKNLERLCVWIEETFGSYEKEDSRIPLGVAIRAIAWRGKYNSKSFLKAITRHEYIKNELVEYWNSVGNSQDISSNMNDLNSLMKEFLDNAAAYWEMAEERILKNSQPIARRDLFRRMRNDGIKGTGRHWEFAERAKIIKSLQEVANALFAKFNFDPHKILNVQAV